MTRNGWEGSESEGYGGITKDWDKRTLRSTQHSLYSSAVHVDQFYPCEIHNQVDSGAKCWHKGTASPDPDTPIVYVTSQILEVRTLD